MRVLLCTGSFIRPNIPFTSSALYCANGGPRPASPRAGRGARDCQIGGRAAGGGRRRCVRPAPGPGTRSRAGQAAHRAGHQPRTGSITIRDLASGRNYGFSGSLCTVGGHFGALALCGSQAEWWTDWQGDDYHQDIGRGRFGGKANEPALEETGWTECSATGGDGDIIPALGAANGHVLYTYDLISAGETEDYPCQMPVKKLGGVYDATVNKHLGGTPPALDFAASGTDVALVPLDSDPQANTPSPAGHAIHVYDTSTGKLVATAAVAGKTLALALSPDVLAVLAKSTSGIRLATFDPSPRLRALDRRSARERR